jgi:hypothetical protein
MSNGVDEVSASLLRGAVRAGVDTCVYLPDSCLTPVIRAFQSSGRITMIPCAREDEGVALAVGLELGGRTAVCMMEASGIGYSALILARAQVQRTPVIIVASHTAGAGELHDPWKTAVLSEGSCGAGILRDRDRASRLEPLITGLCNSTRSAHVAWSLIPPFIAVASR